MSPPSWPAMSRPLIWLVCWVQAEAHYRHWLGDHGRWWQISGTAGSPDWLPVVLSELTVLLWPSCRPQPPTQNMNLGPGALAQSSSSQGLHSQGGLSDAVGAGLPPPSLLQGQIGNGEHRRTRAGLGLRAGSLVASSHGGVPLAPLAPGGLGRSAAARRGRHAGKKALTLGQAHLESGPGAPRTLGRERHAPGSCSSPCSSEQGPESSARGGPVGGCTRLKAPGPSPAGPSHVAMQQTAQSTLPTTSMSMSGGGHGSGPGYSHAGPASQSVPLQGQGAISSYVSRANISMQSNPGSAPGPARPHPRPCGPPARAGGAGGPGGCAPLDCPPGRGWAGRVGPGAGGPGCSPRRPQGRL